MNSDIRLTDSEKRSIVEIIKALDPHADIYLYGSRVDSKKLGGDLDLLVVSEDLEFSDKVSLLINLKKKLGDQKIDLSIRTSSQLKSDAFFNSAGIKLVKIN